MSYSDDETEVYLVGFPVLMGWIYGYKTQIMMVMVVSVVLMVIVLFILARVFKHGAAMREDLEGTV